VECQYAIVDEEAGDRVNVSFGVSSQAIGPFDNDNSLPQILAQPYSRVSSC
jgi:hypothetical protein